MTWPAHTPRGTRHAPYWWTRAASLAIGARVREARRAAGLSLEQLATAIGSHRPIMGRLERGTYLPNLETLQTVAPVLGVSVIWLVEPLNVLQRWLPR